ncbi:glycosyltransferase [Flavisolibacter tropicus]|uniref:Glycosyl transferase n=1 Tax=Flavisolibacter tropicus TaxID=1492898 RepID=A0A172TYD7_9BACT|nr:nucleotide disphospho-sugar-binding domain-containing protein [Flavisolibacter tropicus]ANE51978.1 glycosyl transferase [Flavisolibacter tropicus]
MNNTLSTVIDHTIASQIKPGTKILFATFPADGHFNPLTGLAMHLKQIGCDVRWYTAKKYANKLQQLDIPHYDLVRALDFASGEPDEIFPERKQHKSQLAKLKFDIINVFIKRGPEFYDDIKEIHQTFPFEVMIADVAFTGTPMVKEKMNIPVITVGILPLPETSKDLAPYGLAITPNYSFWGKKKQTFLRFVADQVLFRKPYLVMKEMLADYGIKPDGNLFSTLIRKSSLVLQSGTPGFEYFRSDLGHNIRFAGALLPYTTQKQTTPWYNKKLEQYDKVILVTQGTVEKDVEKIIVPTLEAFKDSDCLVVVTTGGSRTLELRLRYPQNNIIIEDFIPFGDVMPYADVYITNGGYGGVMLGIENQLPMVVAGVHEGKNEICARVGYFQLGINLKTEQPIPAQIRNSVEEILSNVVYKKNVVKLSKEFAQYKPNELCAKYVAQLVQQESSSQKVNVAAVEAVLEA